MIEFCYFSLILCSAIIFVGCSANKSEKVNSEIKATEFTQEIMNEDINYDIAENIDWLIYSKSELSNKSDEEIIEIYCNSKLFEYHYRNIIKNELLFENNSKRQYLLPISTDIQLEGGYNFSLSSFLTACNSKESFYNWIDSIYENEEPIQQTINNVISSNRKNMEKAVKEQLIQYISNLEKAENGSLNFKDKELFFDCVIFNEALTINSYTLKSEKINAYNDNFVGKVEE